MSAVDLAAFAPDDCGFGHDLRVGAGYRRVSSFPCLCAGLARHHIKVQCAGCEAEGRAVAFYYPPHQVMCACDCCERVNVPAKLKGIGYLCDDCLPSWTWDYGRYPAAEDPPDHGAGKTCPFKEKP